jgi:hypothetical protein
MHKVTILAHKHLFVKLSVELRTFEKIYTGHKMCLSQLHNAF